MVRITSSRRLFREFRKGLSDYLRQRRQRGKEPESGEDEPPPPKTPVSFAERRGRLRAYAHLLDHQRVTIAVILFLGLIASVAEMVLPMGMGLIVDRVLQNPELAEPEKRHWIILGCGLLLGIALVSPVFDNLRFIMVKRVNVRLMARLRQRLYDQLMHLPLRELQAMKSGGIVARLGSDVDSLAGLVQMGVISPAVALTRLLVAGVILFAWNWQLGLILIGMILPFGALSLIWVRRGRPIWEAAHEQRSQVSGRVSESFGGVRVVRSFGREAREHRAYAVGHHTVARKQLLAYWLIAVIEGGWELMMPLTGVAILWWGSLMVLADQATVGQILAYSAYVGMLLFPIYMIVSSLGQIQEAIAAMDRVFDVLEKPRDKPDPPDAVNATSAVESIRLEGMHFAYEPEKPVLQDINLSVPGGATVALVGPSGAGKSTLVDLIARFHDPTAGRILLNGIDLRQIKLKSFRRLLGIVEQEVFLFDGTVRDNIAYGQQGASDAEVQAAAERANAHRFIAELPEGYDTLIGERGVKLSGGQRQRLSIARALLADPAILILDEATSNLDSESEHIIQQALAELMRHRTTFVIAHRLSTITHADLIVVMDQGRVVQVGDHEELLAQDGLYRDMVARQRNAFDEPRLEPTEVG